MILRCLLLFIITIYAGVLFGQDRIKINIPTVEEESEYIWRNLHDLKFFEEHNYSVSWPKGSSFETIKKKARREELKESDYESLKDLLRDSIYDASDYQNGYNKIISNVELLNLMVNELSRVKRKWAYKVYEEYEINLTLYGPGGSYNANDGSIIIMTTPEGGFKQHPNPVNTLIHEIVHIGIEDSIIVKYEIPHALKERIVDKLVLLHFEKQLPEYQMQNMGDERIDEYLKNKKYLRKLESIVVEFMRKYYKNN